MKIIKPQRLSLLTHVFERERRFFLVSTLMGAFPFDEPDKLVHEADLWKTVIAQLETGQPFDVGMFKQHGEVLVTGNAFPGTAEAQPGCQVRLCVSRGEEKLIDKSLLVIGDRIWEPSGMSMPKPFKEMPVDYKHAFGGDGYKLNPTGKGYVPTEQDGQTQHPLPNVEHPKHLIKSKRDRPAPAGFGPYDLTWPQRWKNLGTYDRDWLKHEAPGYAKDMDWGLFNAAPEDQQIEGYFTGAETVLVEFMHKERTRLESRLPRLAGRCFIQLPRGANEPDEFRDMPIRLDTVHLFPNAAVGIVIFRGVTEIREDDATDVSIIVAAFEEPGQPKPVSHYEQVRDLRMDKERSHLFALRDGDLLPPHALGPQGELGPDDDGLREAFDRENIMVKNQRRKAQREVDKTRAQLEAAGLDPDDYPQLKVPDESEHPDVSGDNLADVVDKALEEAEENKKKAELEKEKRLEEVRKLCEQEGIDLDEVMEKNKKAGAGPPKFSAKAELERMRDTVTMGENAGFDVSDAKARVNDPETATKLYEAERQLKNVYRMFGHHQGEVDPAAEERSLALRMELEADHEAGEPIEDRDLTGVSLQGLSAPGIVLRRSFLEGANLQEAQLAGADLTESVFIRANLRGADLTGAKLHGANLGGADLTGAKLDGIDLGEGVLAGANLERASFDGADLSQVDLTGATFKETTMARAKLTELKYLEGSFGGVHAAGADFTKGVFIKADLRDVDFRSAILEQTTFVECTGDRANFAGVDMKNSRIVHNSSFEGACFDGAKLERSNLRATKLKGATFRRADIRQADLSEADLRETDFTEAIGARCAMRLADLRHANLERADLMESVLAKANIRGTSFRGASLFRSDMARVKGDQGTIFEGANLKWVRFIDGGPQGQGSDGDA